MARGTRSQRIPVSFVRENPAQRTCKCPHIFSGHKHAGVCWNSFRDRARRAGDNGQAVNHRFGKNQSVAFIARRKRKDRRTGITCGQCIRSHHPLEAHSCTYTKTWRQGL